jgi:fatty-acyl-CoA synthase
LNIRLSADQVAYIVNHAQDKVVFVEGSLLRLYEQAAADITCVEKYVLFNADRDVQTSLPNVYFYEDLLAEASADYAWPQLDENAAAGMCYTSGTTGNPKGALYSHRSTYLHAMISNQANALGFTEQDVVLAIVPQFHVMAWGFPYACVWAGSTMIMPGPHLKPTDLIDLVVTENVTVANGVPTIWLGVYQELKANPRDISSLRALVVGGSAVPRNLIQAFEQEFKVPVLHAWGMTEMSPLGTLSKLQSHHQDLPYPQQLDIRAKQGTTMAGVELRIMGDNDQEIPWDGESVGEVQVRGACIISSYFKVEPNLSSFTADGWFRTGDVASVDPDGYMNITDRTKDLIKSGGEWISSVALENALMAHPSVLEAAVIAVPDEKWSERPLATVVLDPNVDGVTSEAILDFIRPQFAKFWLPDRVLFIHEVPKTSVGKFDKKTLRQQFAAGEIG